MKYPGALSDKQRKGAFVTSKEFRQWQQDMGWSAAEAARRLGKSADTISNYRQRGVPQREATVVGLACKALYQGIRP